LKVAHDKGVFRDVTVPKRSTDSVVGNVLKNEIKGYLISHAHLNHVQGLVIASPDDSNKTIYSLPAVSAEIEQNYFNWKAWPNMLDRGQQPQLKKYHLEELKPGGAQELTGTRMIVTAFPLNHGGAESTAFLIESGGDAILCFGDTGPDEV
jgi:3',5'-cyclic-nucleotide phosphodiesterase